MSRYKQAAEAQLSGDAFRLSWQHGRTCDLAPGPPPHLHDNFDFFHFRVEVVGLPNGGVKESKRQTLMFTDEWTEHGELGGKPLIAGVMHQLARRRLSSSMALPSLLHSQGQVCFADCMADINVLAARNCCQSLDINEEN